MKQDIAADALVPSHLIAEIAAAADEDHRAARELIGEALEMYLKNRRWKRLVEKGLESARRLGLSEADLPRLIAESRQEQRQGH